ncbi:hypothetical protein E2C01_026873 [Portunus trituberculatus]|uniref:Uncharacterized protein n=1 Tax=Portunus trituberculatus TaxID=210409 RepID=A0A5B7EGG1_PORTR|nr:hypothetical protein [Portunus trituberculatus]
MPVRFSPRAPLRGPACEKWWCVGGEVRGWEGEPATTSPLTSSTPPLTLPNPCQPMLCSLLEAKRGPA